MRLGIDETIEKLPRRLRNGFSLLVRRQTLQSSQNAMTVPHSGDLKICHRGPQSHAVPPRRTPNPTFSGLWSIGYLGWDVVRGITAS